MTLEELYRRKLGLPPLRKPSFTKRELARMEKFLGHSLDHRALTHALETFINESFENRLASYKPKLKRHLAKLNRFYKDVAEFGGGVLPLGDDEALGSSLQTLKKRMQTLNRFEPERFAMDLYSARPRGGRGQPKNVALTNLVAALLYLYGEEVKHGWEDELSRPFYEFAVYVLDRLQRRRPDLIPNSSLSSLIGHALHEVLPRLRAIRKENLPHLKLSR